MNLNIFSIYSVCLGKNSKNKDDNIHKSEALKWKDKQTLTLYSVRTE